MNNTLHTLKELNEASKKSSTKWMFYIPMGIISTSIVLLIVDVDVYITFAVLAIFFSIIALMIGGFVEILQATKRRKIAIDNSIKIVYDNYVKQYNIENDTDYEITTSDSLDKNWLLVPSFTAKEHDYVLSSENQHTTLFYGSAFSTTGSPPKRTYFFRGLYIVLPFPLEGDFQYQEKLSASQKIIETLKPVYQQDQYDVKRYLSNKPYRKGTYYFMNKEEVPHIIQELITYMESIPFVKHCKIAVQDNQLHIALEDSSLRLPYVKKYIENELIAIKQIVIENASLLQRLSKLIEKNH